MCHVGWNLLWNDYFVNRSLIVHYPEQRWMHHTRLIEHFVIHEDKGGFLRRSSAGNGFCDVLLTANLAAACIGHDGQILYTAAQAMFPFPGGILSALRWPSA